MSSNVQKMRDALLRVKEARGRDLEYVTLADIDAEVDAALALPPHNCDIGTEREQYRRFMDWCYPKSCFDCPFRILVNNSHILCFAAWAQMPYEEEGASK